LAPRRSYVSAQRRGPGLAPHRTTRRHAAPGTRAQHCIGQKVIFFPFTEDLLHRQVCVCGSLWNLFFFFFFFFFFGFFFFFFFFFFVESFLLETCFTSYIQVVSHRPYRRLFVVSCVGSSWGCSGCVCLCVFCVGPLCGPPLRWWVLCGALPSVWVPCVGPLRGSPECGSPVWVPRRAASSGIYSRDSSRSFTRSRSWYHHWSHGDSLASQSVAGQDPDRTCASEFVEVVLLLLFLLCASECV